jgi:hydroxymethylpyrimidine/phosphomethylpyrimidine kinase
MQSVPRVLTIAGSDSGAGAGIQADLKAFARCGVYGMSAVTAVTAQNTQGIEAVHHVPARVVRAQIDAVISDIGVDAVKIGMLGRGATARAVVAAIRTALAGRTPLVVDPVIIASSGSELLDRDGIGVLIGELLPHASVVTPNLPEARLLLERGAIPIPVGADDRELARALLALGSRCVVLTGGHRSDPADIYADAEQTVEIVWERSGSGATHGTGCTHSAVLAAELAHGRSALDAARTAARLTSEAVHNGHEGLGQGPGPVEIGARR